MSSRSESPEPAKLSILTESQRNDIQHSVDDSETPWYSGTVNWPSDSLPLFYKVRGAIEGARDNLEVSEIEVK